MHLPVGKLYNEFDWYEFVIKLQPENAGDCCMLHCRVQLLLQVRRQIYMNVSRGGVIISSANAGCDLAGVAPVVQAIAVHTKPLHEQILN